jgi:hypothetical protein
MKLSTRQHRAAEFFHIRFLEGCIGGSFRNTRTPARRAAKSHRVAKLNVVKLDVVKLHKEKKRHHEDDEAGDAGNDNRGGPIHPDSQSVMGCR